MKKTLTLLSLLLAFASVAQVPNYVPTNGLVGYWPFNGNANDESGNGNNGTVNGATLTTDRFGAANKAYSFDGINQYIAVSRNYISTFSVSIWFNTGGSSIYNPIIDAFDTNWEIQLKNSSLDYVSFMGASYQEFISSNTVTNGNWYHLICTFDSNIVKFFVNGILVDQYTVNSIPNNNGNYFFGASLSGSDQFFNGNLDDIGIWNRALTQCEIQDLYHSELNSLAVSGGPDATICAGQSMTFNGTGAVNYNWSNGIADGVPHVFTPIDLGNNELVVTGVDANGCVGTDTVSVWVNSATASTLNETALDSYTLNGQTYTQSGTYTQVIPNAAGCDSTITLNLVLDYTGIKELENTVVVAPNPASEQFTITASSPLFDAYILYDPQGRIILEGTLTGTTTILQVATLAKGNYLLKIAGNAAPKQLVIH
jgi:hypothetical protein